MKKILLATASALLLNGAAVAAHAATHTTDLMAAIAAQAAAASQAPSGIFPDPNLSSRELGPGHPLMKGLSGPEELASLIEVSLQKKDNGTALIDEKRCALNGSCATPQMYLEGIQKWHPKSGLRSVDELPRFIRGLAKQVVKNGKYYSARMVHVRGQWLLDLNSGFQRTLMVGEEAWVDTQTGEVILLENCGNIALDTPLEEVPVASKPSCIIVTVVVERGSDFEDRGVRAGINGPAPIPKDEEDRCLAVKGPGDRDFVKGLPDQCKWGRFVEVNGQETTCDVKGISSFVRQPNQKKGGVNVTGKAGVWTFRLPPIIGRAGENYFFWACNERHTLNADGSTQYVLHSHSKIVSADDYQDDGAARSARVEGWKFQPIG